MDDPVGSLSVDRLSGYGNGVHDLEFIYVEMQVCGTPSSE